MKATYYDEWNNYADLKMAYSECPQEDNIIYAGYSYEDYSGSAIVVFFEDGKLFENNDGHCSCNGLEHWDPEETSLAALRIRKGWPGLQDALDQLECIH